MTSLKILVFVWHFVFSRSLMNHPHTNRLLRYISTRTKRSPNFSTNVTIYYCDISTMWQFVTAILWPHDNVYCDTSTKGGWLLVYHRIHVFFPSKNGCFVKVSTHCNFGQLMAVTFLFYTLHPFKTSLTCDNTSRAAVCKFSFHLGYFESALLEIFCQNELEISFRFYEPKPV
jgi:hypothetical protein